MTMVTEPVYIIEGNIRLYEELLTREGVPMATLETVRRLLAQAKDDLQIAVANVAGQRLTPILGE